MIVNSRGRLELVSASEVERILVVEPWQWLILTMGVSVGTALGGNPATHVMDTLAWWSPQIIEGIKQALLAPISHGLL